MATLAVLTLSLAAAALGASDQQRSYAARCGTYTLVENQQLIFMSPSLYQKRFLRSGTESERQSSDVLSSPRWNLGTVRCQWNIRCPSEDRHYLEFRCPWFRLPQSVNCIDDRLVIFQNGRKNVQCGLRFPDVLTTPTGWAQVAYMSTGKNRHRYFICTAECRAVAAPDTTAAPDAPDAPDATAAPDAPDASASTEAAASTNAP